MLISIITATYNSEAFIAEALNSYKTQSYLQKESILIDGNSKDRTLSILKDYLDCITVLKSEKDHGIYDALNKGIQLAKGEIIGILHSDDLFANDSVLEKIAQQFKSNPTLMAVYGDLEYVDRNNPNKIIRYWKSGSCSLKALESGWMPPHPTLFIKKECFTKLGMYNLNYNSAADYDLILRFFYKHQLKLTYIPEVLVKMRVGGLSNKSLNNRWKANQEDRTAMKQNGIPFPFLAGILKPLRKLNQYWTKKS
jgi:glycosyltransferase